ncbi:MAG: AAA family ATPase [Verrucomicrobia bacterium]|nr:AAA family ATPase [Verrucomicrobiota bacterium]
MSPERGGDITFDAGIAQREFDVERRGSYRLRNYAEQFRNEAVARLQMLFTKMGFSGARPRDVRTDIENMISSLLPGFHLRIHADGAPFYELTRLDSGGNVTKVEQLSSGESQLFTLGLDLLTVAGVWLVDQAPRRIILLDEPDLHLHPDLQQTFARFVVTLAEAYELQVVVASHSTTLLAALGFHGKGKTSVAYLSPEQPGTKAKMFDKYLAELATCLGGHALMGPLFSFPLLLVEGDDDYRIWAQACRSGKLRLSVIPSNGEEIKKHGRTLEALFSALVENHDNPSAFLLRDRDDREIDLCNVSGRHVRRMFLSCREAENLYLTNEVLAEFESDWEKARTILRESAKRFPPLQARLVGLVEADKKQSDLKGLMETLAQILDPKGGDWRLRIGQCLGRSRPTGELADFLGNQVMSAFWPVAAIASDQVSVLKPVANPIEPSRVPA